MNRVEQLQNVQKEALTLFKRKNKDYGDSFANFGPVGVIVRMGDKIHRLISITKTGVRMVNNETIRDTLIDLHNYSAMAVMLLDEEKDDKIHFQQSGLLSNKPTRKRNTKKETNPDSFGKFEEYTKGFGGRMLLKMGYKKGSGLGKNEDGDINFVESTKRNIYDKSCLGYKEEKKKEKKKKKKNKKKEKKKKKKEWKEKKENSDLIK